MPNLLDPVLLAKVGAALVIVNLVLSALDAALERIKGMTASDLDDKAYAIAHPILGFLGKVLDWISANRPH